uniref:Acyltransferase n=1 Tax=Micromonospora echinospora TaxID=1877 RepID=A0A2C9DJT6_MICEC|nr:acyltransferase [Micromonospora echinospora]
MADRGLTGAGAPAGRDTPAEGPPQPPPALLMPGQGSQYQGMGTGLYRDVSAFAAIIDEVFELMGRAGEQLRSDWLAASPQLPVDHASRSQPLLFAIDYALGRLLLDRGLRPAVLLGHSVGEMAAATLAGIFDLPGATRIVGQRVGQFTLVPPGGMAAVAASRAEVEPYLRPGVDVGAVNTPRQTVIAGADEPLRTTVDALRQAGYTCAPVPSTVPFHSEWLRPAVAPACSLLASLPANPPRIPVVSGYTAGYLTEAEVKDPRYWAEHPVNPVLFWPALARLAEAGPHLLVECGPGTSLTTFARRHPDVRSGRCEVLSLIGPAASGPAREAEHLAAAAARLGVSLP